MKAILSSLLFISLLTAVGRLFSLSAIASAEADAVGAGAQGNRPPAPARASTTQQPADGGWPRAYVAPPGARLVNNEPQTDSWLDQKRTARYAAVPCTDFGAQQTGTAAAAPTVLVSQNPAELMLLNGAAAYTPIMGTRFERVSNTGGNVFRPFNTGTVYLDVSGRWLTTQDRTRGYGGRYGPGDAPYTRGGAAYGPCGAAAHAAWYNPRTGNCARGATAWGPGGADGAASVSRSAA